MKKSEMLDKLEFLLTQEHPINEFRNLAKSVLELVEADGMRPPCCAKWGGHGRLTQRGDCADYVESCDFGWEEE